LIAAFDQKEPTLDEARVITGARASMCNRVTDQSGKPDDTKRHTKKQGHDDISRHGLSSFLASR
jgi:hypothetical protein